MPRALLASVVITSAIYLLVAFTAFGAIDPEAMARSESPLTLAGDAIAPWERPFRVPLSIGRWPVLPMLGIACCAALLMQFEATVYTIGGVIECGLVLYTVRRRRTNGSSRTSAADRT